VLFGAESVVGPGFLQSLHEDLLRQVFRRRAFETHPDRAGASGVDPLLLTQQFQEVQAAKALLSQYVAQRQVLPPPRPRHASTAAKRPKPASKASHKAPPKTQAETPPAAPRDTPPPDARASTDDSPRPRPHAPGEYYWRGGIPNRRLPLGEYLYYSGHISMQALIAAIHAQRKGRPLFGQIAMTWGYLQPGSIAMLLARKKPGEKLGESARRLGLLTVFQCNAILGLQWGKQRRFGHYFTASGLLTERQLADLVRAHHWHNFSHAPRRAS
jgi:hypothetical protein